MSDLDELAALYAALEANPDDRVTRLALGDWYEDHDRPEAAACLHWLAAHGKHPYQYRAAAPLRYHHESWAEAWYWWTTENERDEQWGYPDACTLPFPLWDRLRHTFDYDPTTFKEYPTLRATYEALIDAWEATPRNQRPQRGKK
jgi:uncharacterized protein (TIGR02996 family)